MAQAEQPVLIKRYAGSRRYDGRAARYVTRATARTWWKTGDGFVVQDAKIGGDVTSSILKQIIRKRTHHG
jgi:polyhydroxyalkanoate synthesis regulator protein